ncbi:DUF3800 domain-containing protein [Candidatus Woesearchaeota archaeon]|nr:DUF3800 domain-containing protein [Candidatus Woesearchaeota archaeon]
MYVDETGINEKYTILSGVIIHSRGYNLICKEIERLLLESFGTNKIILKEIRKRYYYNNEFTQKQYLSFREGYYDLLMKKTPVFIVSAVDNDWARDNAFTLEKAYEHLLERFHKFLRKKGNSENGQVIYDKSQNYFKIIKQKHKNLLEHGSWWGWEFSLINHLFEKDDCECRALQIADLLGAAMNSLLNYTSKKEEHYLRCLLFFDRSSEGKIKGYGIKIFPDSNIIDTF